VVDHLRAAHACHTVILYGSLGALAPEPDPASDLDVMAVSAQGPARRDSSIVAGLALDAWIYPAPAESIDESYLVLLRDGAVLAEEGSSGRDLIERARRVFARGPAPVESAERAHRLAWARRTVGRVRARGAGSGEGRYRRAVLLVELLEWWFRLRSMWFLGPRDALAWLEAHRPDDHRALAAALDPAATPDDLARAVDRVFAHD
jgi:hypothetical protein